MASHDHSSAIHFFKIILKSTLQQGKLRISNKFTGRYGCGFPNPVFLKPPDGTEWEVYWIKHDGEIWFQKGWKEFAKYYSLDHGHLVMFTYEGTSNLGVVILDISGIEIDYAYHGPHDYISDDSVEILDEIPPQQEAKLKPQLSSLQTHKKMRTGTTSELKERSSLQIGNMHDHSLGSGSPRKQFHNSINANLTSTRKEVEEDVGRRIFGRVKALTATKKTEALRSVRTFRSENPFCVIVMQPSYVSKPFSLYMPAQFTEKHLKEKHGIIHLQVLDGRDWSATYNASKIYGGWKKFATDNNLKVGDVCIFELTKVIDLSFKILIFRLNADSSCTKSQDEIEPESRPRSKVACFYPMNNVKGSSGLKDDYFEERCGGGISTSSKRQKFEVLGHMQTNLKNTPHEKAIDTKIVCKTQEAGANSIKLRWIPDVDTRTVCSRKDGKATLRTSSFIGPGTSTALEEAKRFSSENPLFIINIKPCHLANTSPHVSCDFIRRYIKNKVQKVLVQFGKRSWPIKLLYYPDISQGKFSAGWALFAKENKLGVGDACVFELINKEEVVLGVHIFRCQN